LLPVERSTPTTRQRELAERLRELRALRELTVESVAASLLVSASKVSRLETAARRASPRDVRDLCLLYAVSNDERDRLMSLAAQALETTWYQDADVRAEYRTFIGLEEAATDIATYQALVVPGLLQTPDYARALLDGLRPPGTLTAERIDDVVAARLRRQKLLRGPNPPRVHAIFDEAVLQRPIGSPEVMAPQVARLIECADLPNITVQVIPITAGSHPGLDGRFTVLRFGNQAVSDTVYIEGLLGELFLDKDIDVARYMEIFQYLGATVALTEKESLSLLDQMHTHWIRS
jgi:transcriptional regulator with XRE-family HTH domain